MSDEAKRPAFVQTRRAFMATTTALAGAAAIGLPRLARGAQRHPKRGGVLRFATRDDTRGLDSHRNFVYYVSHPMAGTTGGLLDFNGRMEPVPAIATEWDVSKDLKTWTFKLRRGAEFHNGESIDAEAVKWNYERIMDPKIGHSFTRGVLGDLERVSVDDKYTVRCHLKNPSAIFAANLIYYPANLMAPGSVDQADTHPVSCGPFKFKSWKRHDATELERFENFWETDAEGNALPYLDGLIGYPKKEDRVRLTALRTGEVDLIDNMAYADAAEFESNYGKDFNTWEVRTSARPTSRSTRRTGRSRRRTIPTRTCCAWPRRTPSTMRVSIRRSSTSAARSRRASTASRAPGTPRTSSPGRNTTRTRRARS